MTNERSAKPSVSREEMLGFIDEMEGWDKRRQEISDAIRALILAVGEWKEETKDMLNFFGIRLPLRVRILFEQIRDFKEGK